MSLLSCKCSNEARRIVYPSGNAICPECHDCRTLLSKQIAPLRHQNPEAFSDSEANGRKRVHKPEKEHVASKRLRGGDDYMVMKRVWHKKPAAEQLSLF